MILWIDIFIKLSFLKLNVVKNIKVKDCSPKEICLDKKQTNYDGFWYRKLTLISAHFEHQF